MLACHNIHSGYGSGDVIRKVTLRLDEGSIIAVLGPNGAGKSTLLKTLCGVVPLRHGSVTYKDTEMTQLDLRALLRLGVVYVPEGRELFPAMTVRENLLLGATLQPAKITKQLLDHINDVFPRLAERATQRAGTLSGGEQQMLAIGRALMAQPKVLLLDEPSFGLAPTIVNDIASILTNIRDKEGTSIILVEQNLSLAERVADRFYVLVNGEIRASGTKAELGNRGTLAEVYLG